MVNIPVRHMTGNASPLADPQNARAAEFVLSYPCIDVDFYWSKAQPVAEASRALALIDTGADHIYVRPELIEKHGCPSVPGMISNINGGAARGYHRASLRIVGTDRVVTVDVISHDAAGNAWSYDIVLGRRFLQFCRLGWDGHAQTVTLDFGLREGAF